MTRPLGGALPPAHAAPPNAFGRHPATRSIPASWRASLRDAALGPDDERALVLGGFWLGCDPPACQARPGRAVRSGGRFASPDAIAHIGKGSSIIRRPTPGVAPTGPPTGFRNDFQPVAPPGKPI